MTRSPFDGSFRDLLRDTAQTVSFLSQGGPVASGAQLRLDALRQVEAMDAALTERGLDEAVRRELVFAQCGLLDEVALRHLSPADRHVWETAPLQVERFGDHDAGDRVFANLDAWLRRPDADVHLLEFYAAIIGLGFQGRYARDGDDARTAMLDDLGRRVAANTTSIPTRFITYEGHPPGALATAFAVARGERDAVSGWRNLCRLPPDTGCTLRPVVSASTMRALGGGGHATFLLAGCTVALLAFLLLCMLPLSLVTAWLSLACCTLVVAGGTAIHHRRGIAARVRHAAVLRKVARQTAHLPLDLRSDLPLVLVVGDGLDSLFGEAAAGASVHRGDGALWLRVDDVTLLASMAIAVREARDGRPPAGVVMTIAPARYSAGEDILQPLGRLRQAVADAARELHHRLPVLVAVYQRLSSAPAIDVPPWYGVRTSSHRPDAIALTPLWHAAYGATGHRESARCAAMLDHLMHWTTTSVVPALTDPRDDGGACEVAGVAWVDAGPAQSATQTWASMAGVSGTVGLPAMPASSAPWPWPAPLLQSLPRWSGPSPRQRDLARAACLVCVTLALALMASALGNARLMENTASHMHRFADTAPGGGDMHRNAVAVLVDDRDQLERHQRTGVPLQLGVGLYRGRDLLPRIDAAIASYRPPAIPPMVITLDGMALFDVGKASIRSGSNHAMVGALELIRAHPDKRILVAGHTDDTGRADANLALSTARAESVRAWLMEASDLPAPRFAIQGYGDTRPVVANADAQARARNRRVEISLVTDTYPH